VFELISAVRYFAGDVESDAASAIGFAIFFKSDTALAIGFARLASSGCDIELIINGFPTLRIIEWLVWLSHIGRGS